MSGLVFHPGHHELHGVTVIVETRGGRTYIGRFDRQEEASVHLLDVAVHDSAAGIQGLDEFVARSAKFGVRVEQRHVVVPAPDVVRIRRLGEVYA